MNTSIFRLVMIFFILLSGCDKNSLNTDTNTSVDKNYYTNAPIPNKGKLRVNQTSLTDRQYIGAGYDIMGAYLANSSVKAPIFDLTKFSGTNYFSTPWRSSFNESFAGKNANEYLLDINGVQKVEVPEANSEDLLFTETITKNNFINTRPENYSEQFSFASINSDFSIEKHKLTWLKLPEEDNNDRLFTDEFISDISTLSADEIITKYGTHVIGTAYLGYNVNNFYRTVVNADNKDIKDIALIGVGKRKGSVYISPEETTDFDNEKVIKNHGGCLTVEFCGGNLEELPNYRTNGTGLYGDVMDIKLWKKSINSTNYALTKLEHENLIPIYELFNDESLSARLKEATIAYIKSKQIEIVQTVPIFQAYNENNYRYFTSYDNMTNSCDEGYTNGGVIGSLFVEEIENSAPLYLYSNNKSDRLSFNANLAPEHGMELKGIIGYCFEGSYTSGEYYHMLHEATNGENYIYKFNKYSDTDEDWKYTDNVIYVRNICGDIIIF